MIVPVAMAMLLNSCAPSVGSITMSAVVQYESGWNPNAIGDNTAKRSYYPQTRNEAMAIATGLLKAGHNLDAGLAQVNSGNWRGYGVSVNTIFEPCTNLHVGAQILTNAYTRALAVYPSGTVALWHALEAYNTGKLNGRPKYAYEVFRTALTNTVVPTIPAAVSLTPSSQGLLEIPVLAPGSFERPLLEPVFSATERVTRVFVKTIVRSSVSIPITGARAFWFPTATFTLPAASTRPLLPKNGRGSHS